MGVRMRRIYGIHDLLKDDELVFTGGQTACGRFIGCALANITQAFRKHAKIRKRYWLEHLYDAPIEMPEHYETKKQPERIPPIDAESLRQFRRSIPIGQTVRCFEYLESTDTRKEYGIYPIVEKYRHIFTIQRKGYTESYSWIQLYRKDGVELA